LRSLLTEKELSKRLLNLFRKSRVDLEEGGVNTLYLALGFLEWSETDCATRVYRAPLLLIPVKLTRQSVQSGYKLERFDEDASINVTLLELLRSDHALTINGVNPPPLDDSGVDVEKIFQIFRQEIKNQKGWEIKTDVWLGRFSFNKFIMWNDLNNRLEELLKNNVVNHLVNYAREPFINESDAVQPSEIDKKVDYSKVFCPSR